MRVARQRHRFGDAALAATPATHQWGTQPEMFGPRHLHRLGLILSALRGLPPHSLCLDAACGLGQLAVRIKARGHRAFGVDGEIAAALATSSSGVPAVVADLTRLPFRDGTFDAVTSGETLEHVEDDRAAARELGRVAHSRASCVVTVPALRALWSSSDVYYGHRRRYSRKELVQLMASAGFEVERADFWGFPFTLLYDVLVLLPMNRRRARRQSNPLIARAGRATLLVSMVRALLSLDRLFRFVPFGPGLLLIATKR